LTEDRYGQCNTTSLSNFALIGSPFICSIRIKTILVITKTRCTVLVS